MQVVSTIAETTVIREGSLFVSRKKTPIGILILGAGEPKLLALDSISRDIKVFEDIVRLFPSVGDLLT